MEVDLGKDIFELVKMADVEREECEGNVGFEIPGKCRRVWEE